MKMKSRHRKYTGISLRYSQTYSLISDTERQLATIFGEKISLWRDYCSLRLCLQLNGKTIWSTCDINVLLEMYLKSGKYYPFTCDDCADCGCAGIFAHCRIIHCGDDIILCLRNPLQKNNGQRWCYRACKLRKKDFLSELLNAVHFRISLEDALNIKIDVQGEECSANTMKLLTDIFGYHDAAEYQYKISQTIRKAYPKLEKELLKMMGEKAV